MTELTGLHEGTIDDSFPTITQRTTHRSALRPALSRRALHAEARAEARRAHGRNAFVWRGRVLPIGAPLAVGAGLFVWRRRRSARDALGVTLVVAALSYIEARAEWGVWRVAHRRRHE